MQASAIVSLNVKGQTEITGAVGNGPVNALDIAMRRALCVFYPQISSMHLSDFKVRVIDMSSTTAAKIRVLIESTNGDESWTTIGVSTMLSKRALRLLRTHLNIYYHKKENNKYYGHDNDTENPCRPRRA